MYIAYYNIVYCSKLIIILYIVVSLKTLEIINADQMSGRFRGFKQKYKVDIENMRVKRDERKNKYLQNTRTLDISEMFTSARDLLKEKQEFLDVSCPLLNQVRFTILSEPSNCLSY